MSVVLVVLLFFGGLFFVGAVNFKAVIFFGWLVFCLMLFFMVGWFLVVFWFGLFFGCCKVWGWFQLLGVWFLFRFCWFLFRFLSFWMLGGVVFMLGRWLVWWFGFCGVFGFLSSFASLYRFNFASFYIFCWLVYSSARFLCVAYFYFFEGSGMVLAFCLWFLCRFVVIFCDLFIFSCFSSFCQTFLFFVSFFLIFSGFFIAIYYKLIGANDGLASFGAFELVNFHYKKVLENLTNCGRLYIISCWGGLEVLPFEVLPHKLPHTQRHTPHTAPPTLLYSTYGNHDKLTTGITKKSGCFYEGKGNFFAGCRLLRVLGVPHRRGKKAREFFRTVYNIQRSKYSRMLYSNRLNVRNFGASFGMSQPSSLWACFYSLLLQKCIEEKTI